MNTSIPAAAPQPLLDAPLSTEPAAGSLQRQLHRRIKAAVLNGHLSAGSRLPGSRALAKLLSISRNTVVAAYEHLAAEGYVHSDRLGTRVATLARPPRPAPVARGMSLPLTAQRLSCFPATAPRSQAGVTGLAGSAGVAGMTGMAGMAGMAGITFRPGVPALAQFPLGAWRRVLDRAIQRAGPSILGYGDPLGEPALRAAIARHLSLVRGVYCEPDQVVITEGAQEALSLCVRLLSNPGDTAWVEDPGYRGAKAAMHAGDLRIKPLRVDADGLRVSERDWNTHPPRLIYTTPSHQYPTGGVLSVTRRLELIAAAQRQGAWIIEDDYDSEFRHAAEPIGAMQGLVGEAPVVYVGTFSKTMFPALRLGFLVLPRVLLTATQAALEQMLRGGHRYEQLALADFIESGQFGRHLGRMRRLYRERQQALRESLTRCLTVEHTITGGHAGLHLTVRLPQRYPDRLIIDAARPYGIMPAPLSAFALRPQPEDNGLVLGYGNTSADLFASLVQRLSQLAHAAARRPGS